MTHHNQRGPLHQRHETGYPLRDGESGSWGFSPFGPSIECQEHPERRTHPGQRELSLLSSDHGVESICIHRRQDLAAGIDKVASDDRRLRQVVHRDGRGDGLV